MANCLRPISNIRAFIVALMLCVLFAGCHSRTDPTPKNFIAGLNAYFAEHPDCLFPDPPSFPYETADAQKTRQMDALVNSKMLLVEKAPLLHVSRFTLTPAGAHLGPRFCFGHRTVSAIDSFTPPVNGQSHVTYQYTMQDVPVWVRTDQMQAAFPAMAHEIGGASSDTATMKATPEDWEVWD